MRARARHRTADTEKDKQHIGRRALSRDNRAAAMLDANTLKWASLVIFTLQNAAFVLLMRASKVYGSHYNSAVAVLVTEALKVPFTISLLIFEKGSVGAACSQLYADIIQQPKDTLKISIPALLYTVQNNALFVAVGSLEAAVFQVTYQLKTLTTAVLVVVLLGKKLQGHQWFALLLLSAGAAMVQEPKKSSPSVAADGSTGASALLIGIGATVVACVCSSVASVYLEKILTESKPSIWVRNAQLCIFTIPIAFIGTLMVEDKYIKEDGTPLHGFTPVVWAAIFTNAAGGMLVATVMKFAGNILRNFAQACAIIVGGLVSAARTHALLCRSRRRPPPPHPLTCMCNASSLPPPNLLGRAHGRSLASRSRCRSASASAWSSSRSSSTAPSPSSSRSGRARCADSSV